MIKKALLYFLITCLTPQVCIGQDAWQFKRVYESQNFTNGRYFLFTTADLNQNGMKELIFANFGRFGDHITYGIETYHQERKTARSVPTLLVTEWDKKELKINFTKKWNTSTGQKKRFLAFEAKQIVPFRDGPRMVVETIPPYLGLMWKQGQYSLQEQQGPFNEGPLVGSWIFPWVSPSCYRSFPNKSVWPQECIVGIRDFSETSKPKIVTIAEEEIVRDKKYSQTLRVRKYEPGYPIEWEQELDSDKYYFGTSSLTDKWNQNAHNTLLMGALTYNSGGETFTRFLFAPESGKGFSLKEVKGKLAMGEVILNFPFPYLTIYDLPGVYVRKTQSRNTEEMWGYRYADRADGSQNILLRKITIKSDLSGYISEDIDFSHHDLFIGVGFFDLQDIDGDGLDEVVLLEETGKTASTEERTFISNVQDYIHILKWNGSKYQDMWVSPPYTKRGTKFLIEDIKNTGKKQLVVLSPYGTIQIWEKQ